SAAVSGAEFSAVGISESELPESVDLFAARLSALRLPAVEEFRLCLRAAGERYRGARSRGRLRAQPSLQLQRRTPSEPAHQRQYDSRRSDGGELRGGVLRRACFEHSYSGEPVHRQRLQRPPKRKFVWTLPICRRLADELFPARRIESVDYRSVRFDRRSAWLHCPGRSFSGYHSWIQREL